MTEKLFTARGYTVGKALKKNFELFGVDTSIGLYHRMACLEYRAYFIVVEFHIILPPSEVCCRRV